MPLRVRFGTLFITTHHPYLYQDYPTAIPIPDPSASMMVPHLRHQFRHQAQRIINLAHRNLQDLPWATATYIQQRAQAIAAHRSHLPPLHSDYSPHLQTLQQQNLLITHINSLNLPLTPTLLQATQTHPPSLQTCSTPPQQGFRHVATAPEILTHPVLFLWGLQEPLLDLIENYLGLPITYHGCYYRRDLPVPIEANTRLWHTDMEDEHVVKLILYLQAINDSNGPFQYIPQPLNQTLINRLNYRHGYFPKGQLETIAQQETKTPQPWQSCTGPAGTLIIADTGTLLHRGKIPTTDRYTLFYDYTIRHPRRPYYCKSSLPTEALQSLLPHLTDRQIQCLNLPNPD